jgi:hypothetical protein
VRSAKGLQQHHNSSRRSPKLCQTQHQAMSEPQKPDSDAPLPAWRACQGQQAARRTPDQCRHPETAPATACGCPEPPETVQTSAEQSRRASASQIMLLLSAKRARLSWRGNST